MIGECKLFDYNDSAEINCSMVCVASVNGGAIRRWLSSQYLFHDDLYTLNYI